MEFPHFLNTDILPKAFDNIHTCILYSLGFLIFHVTRGSVLTIARIWKDSYFSFIFKIYIMENKYKMFLNITRHYPSSNWVQQTIVVLLK